jgi:hypothetical protein
MRQSTPVRCPPKCVIYVIAERIGDPTLIRLKLTTLHEIIIILINDLTYQKLMQPSV